MKKNFKYAILSAIALVGAVSFSACSSSEDLEDVNPTYDGKTVKAQFAISIPAYGQNPTRMTSLNTQQEGFLGISDLRFYPFSIGSVTSGEYVVASSSSYSGATVISGTDKAIGKTGTGAESTMDALHTAAKDKWYMNVEVPTTTNAFLVYGKATTPATPDKFNQGSIIPSYDPAATTVKDLLYSGDKPVSSLSFSQEPIATEDAFSTGGSTILVELNKIVAATGYLNATDAAAETKTSWITVGGYTAATASDKGVTTLKDLFDKFTLQVTTTAGFAASSSSVLAMLEDLKESLKTQSTYNTAGYLANDIYTKTDAAITALTSAYGTASTAFPSGSSSLNLPDGAAKLKYTAGATNPFSFDLSGNVVNNINASAVTKYVYPAELYYRANTPIRVANKEMSTNTAITNTSTWNDVIALYNETNNKAVTSTTRSIALVNPLQYAVGCLDTWISLDNVTTLQENALVPGSSTTYKTVDISSGLKLTGILIGSQGDVDWEFRQAENGSNIIYDKVMDVETKVLTTTDTHMNYTLVMETKGVSGTISSENTEIVYVALEFDNDFADFSGADGNLIPKGTKFYLVGKLDLNSTKVNGTGDNTRTKVFEQDYTTVAKFKINSLKNAYNTVPDLRTPSLELGLSVNLEWIPGLTFEVPID